MAVIFLIVWIAIAIAIGAAAKERGRGAFAWFLVSLIFSPIVALLLLLAFPARERLDNIAMNDAELRRNIRRSSKRW